jgi:hypothetical protein
MNKIYLAIFLVATSIQLSSCRKVVGDGPVVTQQRTTADFNGIEMAVPGEMYYTTGSHFSVEIKAQQNILDIIETHVSGNRLKVKVRDGVNIKSHEPVIVNITAPDVFYLAVNGSGSIKVLNEYHPANAELVVSGSGWIKMQQLVTGNLEARISGSGEIEATNGSAAKEKLSISGSGKIDFLGIVADDVTTSTSGSGNMRVHAVSFLDCRISGSGEVRFKGNPKITSSISGSGKILSI